MTKWFGTLMLAMAVAVVGVSAQAADKSGEKEFKAKCPVSGQPAKMEHNTDYKEAKVYFCCPKCKGAFEKDSEKHAVKANHQLTQTKQYKQAKCPLSGGPLNKDTAIKVSAVKVAFCCNKCQGKVSEAEGDAQLTLVFSDKAFEKGFKKNEEKE